MVPKAKKSLSLLSVALLVPFSAYIVIADDKKSAPHPQVRYILLSPRIYAPRFRSIVVHSRGKGEDRRTGTFLPGTNAYLIIPSRDGEELTVFLGTQDPSAVQELLAEVLRKEASQIVCRVKRIGGGFGGKDSRSIFPCLALAVGAEKVGRPVRLNLTRQSDMSMTGHRHPFEMVYRVGFSSEGRFSALDLQLWNNAGHSLDQSLRVMRKAMVAIGNTYQLNNLLIRGKICRTHLPSNTAFRGFGGPQAMFVTETIVEHVAEHPGVDPLTIRRVNLSRQGDLTLFGQVIDDWNIPRLLDQLIQSSDFFARQREVEEFSREHPFRKRALSFIFSLDT